MSPLVATTQWKKREGSFRKWLAAAENGGWEYPLYLFVLCIAQAMLGDGAYALAPSRLSARQFSKPSIV